MKVWMEILRPGIWNEHDYTPEILREVQSSYNPTVIEAPVVIGHPDPEGQEQPAMGWVLELEIRKQQNAQTEDEISLWAYVELNEKGESLIRERQFPKRSVGINPKTPYPGIYYLVHVALLGSSTPAVAKLTEVELKQGFTDFNGILVCAEQSKTITLVWESKEKEYWYRVKPPGRFRKDTFRSKNITAGIRAVMGKLLPQYVPEGGNADSMIIQALRFNKDKYDLAQAKAWVSKHKEALSKMSEEINLATPPDDMQELKAQIDELKASQEVMREQRDEEKTKREEAEKELHDRDLAQLEAKYKNALQTLIDEGNGVPAFIELGVHKVLVEMDAAEIVVETDNGPKSGSTIMLEVFKTMPKFLERREIGGANLSNENDNVEITNLDDSFERGMASHISEGTKVVGMDIKRLADELMSKDEKLTIQEATLKASRIRNGGK